MLLVGQSLQFRRSALAGAFARDDRALVAESARAQVEAGAQALDLNFSIDPPPDEIPWAIAAARSAASDVPLWIDAGRPAAITVALEVCVRGGLVISPRRVDRDGIANGEVEWVMHEASLAADRALVLGVTPPLFFDALAYPPCWIRRACVARSRSCACTNGARMCCRSRRSGTSPTGRLGRSRYRCGWSAPPQLPAPGRAR